VKNAVVTTENFRGSQRTWTAASVQGRHGIRSRSDLAPTGTTAPLKGKKRRRRFALWGAKLSELATGFQAGAVVANR
jgi:hypothetical protein